MVFSSLCVVIGYTYSLEGQYKSPGVGLVAARCVAFWVTGSDNPQVVGSSPTGRTEQSPSHPVYLSDAAGFFCTVTWHFASYFVLGDLNNRRMQNNAQNRNPG